MLTNGMSVAQTIAMPRVSLCHRYQGRLQTRKGPITGLAGLRYCPFVMAKPDFRKSGMTALTHSFLMHFAVLKKMAVLASCGAKTVYTYPPAA